VQISRCSCGKFPVSRQKGTRHGELSSALAPPCCRLLTLQHKIFCCLEHAVVAGIQGEARRRRSGRGSGSSGRKTRGETPAARRLAEPKQGAGTRSPRSETRSPRSEARSPKSETRSPRSETRSRGKDYLQNVSHVPNWKQIMHQILEFYSPGLAAK
jgi:hypothetical protein